MNDKIKKYIDEIQPEIKYCVTCQPYDGGDYIWVLGDESDLEDLLDDYDVPEEIRDEVADQLRCNNCGCNLFRQATIGLKPQSEKEFDWKLEEWEKQYQNQLSEFATFLKSYPYLGAINPFGSQIVKSMSTFPKTIITDQEWYRARRIDNGNKAQIDDFKAPDSTIVTIPEGRYNHYGQSYWYLANSKEAAAKEIVTKKEVMVWMQCVYVQEAKDILDMRDVFEAGPKDSVVAIGIIFSDVLKQVVKRDQGWKPEYFVPRFIADSAKLTGFKGIVFHSRRHFDDNLVLFEPNTILFEFKGKPHIFDSSKSPKNQNSIFKV